MSIRKNHRNSVCDADRWGSFHHGGISSATACRPPSRRSHDGGRGSSRPPRSRNTGSTSMPSTASTGPAITRCTHIGSRPIAAPTTAGRRAARYRQSSQPATSPTAMTRSGRNDSASPARTPAIDPRPPLPRRVGEVDAAEGEHGRPQRQRQPAVPGHRREGDRGHHVEHGERGDRGGGEPAPRPRQGEQPEDDPEVLEQAERALGRQRVAEQLVPAGQDVQRARAVEVQEVDVGDVAAGDALGEVEHEALFHRPAGEAVQPAQRDRHQRPPTTAMPSHVPSAPRGPPAQPTGAAEHERRRVVDDRASGGRQRRRAPGDSSTNCSTMARSYPGHGRRGRNPELFTYAVSFCPSVQRVRRNGHGCRRRAPFPTGRGGTGTLWPS